MAEQKVINDRLLKVLESLTLRLDEHSKLLVMLAKRIEFLESGR